jgi:hypothetical protein
MQIVSVQMSDLCVQRAGPGLGNLSSKTGSGTGFLAQNKDRFLDRNFQGRLSDRKAEQVFKTGDRILKRT